MEAFQSWISPDQALCSTPVLILTASLVILIIHYLLKNRGLPPGPWGLPVLGYWPFLTNETCHIQLEKLQEKYGEFFCFNYAGKLAFNITSHKMLREFHVANADCFERISDYGLFTLMFQDGVAFSNGEYWKTHRKFVLQKFKELGITNIKDNVSGPIYDCAQEMVSLLRTKEGHPVDIMQLATDKCNGIIRMTLFGDGGITEQEVRQLNDDYGQVMIFMTAKNVMLFGKIAKYLILPLLPGFRPAMKHHKAMEKTLHDIVGRHKLRREDERQPSSNFIDAYFKERDDRISKGDPSAQYFTDEALVSNLVQFLGDGVSAVSAFVSLFLKYTVDHQEEQEKVYEELVEVVGPHRDPTMDDKNKLPYTNALIHEIFRTADFFPIFPSMQCCKETYIRGYRIPVGAMTVVNTYACHHDPDIYENPGQFDPTRFITEDGKRRPELPVSFGIGKRSCLGEAYVMNIVFLFLTTLIKNFELSFPPELSSKTNFDFFTSGKMQIIAKPRH